MAIFEKDGNCFDVQVGRTHPIDGYLKNTLSVPFGADKEAAYQRALLAEKQITEGLEMLFEGHEYALEPWYLRGGSNTVIKIRNVHVGLRTNGFDGVVDWHRDGDGLVFKKPMPFVRYEYKSGDKRNGRELTFSNRDEFEALYTTACEFMNELHGWNLQSMLENIPSYKDVCDSIVVSVASRGISTKGLDWQIPKQPEVQGELEV